MKYRMTVTPCSLSIRSKNRMPEKQTTYSVTLESLVLGNGETNGENGGSVGGGGADGESDEGTTP